jgi:Domain of unknown function (DUF4926)
MPFELFADVTRDVADRGLRAGDVGTVVERHTAPGMTEEGYSVEFFDMTGNTVAVVTVPANVLRVPTPADRLPSERLARSSLLSRFPDLWQLANRRVGAAMTALGSNPRNSGPPTFALAWQP